jgi:hypothetical protein
VVNEENQRNPSHHHTIRLLLLQQKLTADAAFCVSAVIKILKKNRASVSNFISTLK